MLSPDVKITKLYYAVDGTKEPFEVSYAAADFEELPFEGSIRAMGKLMRVEEGIMMLLESLEATQVSVCSRCTKPLKRTIQAQPSEWLFYEEKPLEDDAANEALFLNKHQMIIDPKEPIRQELALNMAMALHCEKPCKEFKEPEPGVKALAALRENMLAKKKKHP